MATTRILSRVTFVDDRNDEFRFLDFNSVNTSLGAMVEPRQVMPFRPGHAEIDPNDEFIKVDKIVTGADWREKWTMFNGLHGGELTPGPRSYS